MRAGVPMACALVLSAWITSGMPTPSQEPGRLTNPGPAAAKAHAQAGDPPPVQPTAEPTDEPATDPADPADPADPVGPIPPQRVDPRSMPSPPASQPVPPIGPGSRRQTDPHEGNDSPSAAANRPPLGPVRGARNLRPLARRAMAAIMTDEPYRRARVRHLLEQALAAHRR